MAFATMSKALRSKTTLTQYLHSDNTATLYILHENVDRFEVKTYKIPFVVRDSGSPVLNATYELTGLAVVFSEFDQKLPLYYELLF